MIHQVEVPIIDRKMKKIEGNTVIHLDVARVYKHGSLDTKAILMKTFQRAASFSNTPRQWKQESELFSFYPMDVNVLLLTF